MKNQPITKISFEGIPPSSIAITKEGKVISSQGFEDLTFWSRWKVLGKDFKPGGCIFIQNGSAQVEFKKKIAKVEPLNLNKDEKAKPKSAAKSKR